MMSINMDGGQVQYPMNGLKSKVVVLFDVMMSKYKKEEMVEKLFCL